MENEKKDEPKEEIKENPEDDRIKRINEAADRLELAEKKLAEREAALKEAEALKRLGGTSEHSEPKQEESAKDYMKKVMSGGLNEKKED